MITVAYLLRTNPFEMETFGIRLQAAINNATSRLVTRDKKGDTTNVVRLIQVIVQCGHHFAVIEVTP